MSRLLSAFAALALAVGDPGAPGPAVGPPLPAASPAAVIGTLHVTRFGLTDGATPVVILPDLAGGPWQWSGLIAHLAPTRTVVAVDLPGMDGTPAAPPPLVPRAAADFWAMLGRLQIDHPVLIGSGLGGMLALRLAAEHPDRLSGAIVVDAYPVVPGTEKFDYAQRQAAAKTASDAVPLDRPRFTQYERTILRSYVTDPALAVSLATLADRSDPTAIAQWLREETALDLRPESARIALPLLGIVPVETATGSIDEAKKAAESARIFGSAPNASVEAIGPSRHLVAADQPEAFVRAIDVFLRALP